MGIRVSKDWKDRIVALHNDGKSLTEIQETLHDEGYRGSGKRVSVGSIYTAVKKAKTPRPLFRRTKGHEPIPTFNTERFNKMAQEDRMRALEIVLTVPNMPSEERLFLARLVTGV